MSRGIAGSMEIPAGARLIKVKFTTSACQRDLTNLDTTPRYFWDADSDLLVRTDVSVNCCGQTIRAGDAGISGDRIELSFMTEGKGECFCECGFSLEYRLSGLERKYYRIFLNGLPASSGR